MESGDRKVGGANTIDRAAHVIAVVGGCGILLISSFVLIDVMMRWLANAPVLAVDDLTDLNVAVAIVCCVPAGMVGRNFVTIRFLGKLLGRGAGDWLDLFGDVLTLAFFAALAWQFAVFSAQAQSSGLGSMVLQIPQAPWWWAVTLVLALCVPFQIAVVARTWRRLRGG
ncbi:MAG TPA: TRAP transporter small permease [Stellaceae bacterium]|nr:TRAP transporter small permease [Stellaceae bacterium]